MPLPNITLNDFLTLSNGTYNAGQIDFKTNKKGEVTGLTKVNNFVHGRERTRSKSTRSARWRSRRPSSRR